MKEPLAHKTDIERPVVAHSDPAGQSVGWLTPAFGQIDPTGQLLHVAMPIVLVYEPAAHKTPAVSPVCGQAKPAGQAVATLNTQCMHH